jgi:pilus assembly protein CpaF
MSDTLTLAERQEAAATVRERIDGWVRDVSLSGTKPGPSDIKAKTESEVVRWIRDFNARSVTEGRSPLTDAEVTDLRSYVGASFGNLPAGIQQLVDQDRFTDLHIMGTRCMVADRRDGGREVYASPFSSHDEFKATVRRWASTALNREFSDASPLLNMVLGGLGGHIRVSASYGVSPEPEMSLRLRSTQHRTLDQLRNANMFSGQVEAVLRAAMRACIPICVTGETGAGKTTLINALLESLDPMTRIITIEDERELFLDQQRFVSSIHLETRPPNTAGEGEITMSMLVRESLRKRPDWVVVGETRGAEAIDLLKLGIQGNAVMCSLHADSPFELVDRMALFAAEGHSKFDPHYIASLVSKAVRLIVHVRVVDNKRMISDVVEVTGAIDNSLTTNAWFSADDSGRAQLDIPTHSPIMLRLFEAGLDQTLVSREPWARALR